MKKALLISNRKPVESGGRAEKFATRKSLLKKHDWEIIIRKTSTSTQNIITEAIRCTIQAQKENVDIINSISEPPQLHLIGLLTSELSRRPWVAEFRDPLVTNPDIEPGSLSWILRRAIEWLVLHRADRVVWFDGIQLPTDYFAKTYPSIPQSRWTKLPFMGFESDLFRDIESANTGSEFTITYAGSFYDGWIEPYRFLDGLHYYLDKYDSDIQVQFYGDWDEDYSKYAETLGIKHTIVTNDFVPHEEIVPVLKGSNALLHIGGSQPKNKLNVPTKIWDYVGAQQPILGVIDPNFRAADVIRKNNLGLTVPPDDPKAIAEAIQVLRKSEISFSDNVAESGQFSRRKCVAAFARELDAVIS